MRWSCLDCLLLSPSCLPELFSKHGLVPFTFHLPSFSSTHLPPPSPPSPFFSWEDWLACGWRRGRNDQRRGGVSSQCRSSIIQISNFHTQMLLAWSKIQIYQPQLGCPMIKRFPNPIPQQMHLNSLDALHISSSIRISWHGRLTLLGLKVWTAETSCHLPHLSRCCKTLSLILTENLRMSVIYNLLPTNCSQIISDNKFCLCLSLFCFTKIYHYRQTCKKA